MIRKTAADFDQELLDLYDYYMHGRLDRREFLDRAKKFAVGGLTAVTLLGMLNPHYVLAEQVPPADERIKTERLNYFYFVKLRLEFSGKRITVAEDTNSRFRGGISARFKK